MFTIDGYDDAQPCLLCNANKGTISVKCLRGEVNGSLCPKCLIRLVKIRTEQQKAETVG